MGKIRRLEVKGFRAFGAPSQLLEFGGPIAVIWGPNSQGKTSLAEAIEFLLTGKTVRLSRGFPGKYEHNKHGTTHTNAEARGNGERVFIPYSTHGPRRCWRSWPTCLPRWRLPASTRGLRVLVWLYVEGAGRRHPARRLAPLGKSLWP